MTYYARKFISNHPFWQNTVSNNKWSNSHKGFPIRAMTSGSKRTDFKSIEVITIHRKSGDQFIEYTAINKNYLHT